MNVIILAKFSTNLQKTVERLQNQRQNEVFIFFRCVLVAVFFGKEFL